MYITTDDAASADSTYEEWPCETSPGEQRKNIIVFAIIFQHCLILTLKVLVTTIDALGHFETGYLQHSARG